MPPENVPPSSPQPLPIVIAVLVLLLAGGVLWFVLTRPTGTPPPTPDTGTRGGTPGTTKQTLRDSGTYYTISGAYPSSAGLTGSADALAVKYMKSFVEQEGTRFKDSNVSDLTSEDIQIQGLGGERIYTLDIDYDRYQGPRTVSFVYHMFADTLGAHPNTYYRTFLFDIKTGEGLALDDLFTPTTDYLAVLSELSHEKLPSQLEKAAGTPPDAQMLSAGTTPDADNFQNFYISGPDLVLIFPPYQIGPYALGTTELHIPRSELGNALKVEYR